MAETVISMSTRARRTYTGTFRFSDLNPVNRRPYSMSRFRQLPMWAAEVVMAAGYRMESWDRLVENGTVMEQPAFRGDHRLSTPKTWARMIARRRTGKAAPRGACEDCWGTGLADDFDASVTGTANTPFICDCMIWGEPA
jgi:hypothetical protein